ncbi:MAG TPA: tetratricopeptide repeat protein [Dehalococcoidia bacterium]|nr:tetratricopeptide repeat protein [Dehalococcoidia bacterium]
MAVHTRAITRRRASVAGVYWLASGLATALALAAALLALLQPGDGAGRAGVDAAAETSARGARIAFFEQRLEADPFDVTALNVLTFEYIARARESGDAADYGRALEASGRSLAALPRYEPSLVAAAAARISVHDFAAGLELADRALAARPRSGAGHALRGDALIALGRYDEAEAAYQEALALAPGVGTFARMAHLSFLRGDVANAADFWKQAIAAARGHSAIDEAWARVQFGALEFDRGRPGAAERAAAAALRAHPGSAPALALRARARAARGDLDGAIADYEAALASQPLLEYVIALGDAYAAAGRAASADQSYALVDAIAALYRASGVNTDLSLAVYYAGHGRAAEALPLARQAYEAAPGVYAADALAWALLNAGQPQEAAIYAAEALRLGTPDAALLYHAGMVEKALSNDARASNLLRRALATNPHFSLLEAPRARAALAELEGRAR